MLIIMCVSLFSVRIVLNSLGEVDYGINNVIAGIITMFGFMSSTMSAASMRFFAYDLGRHDNDGLIKSFSVTFWCYFFLSVLAILFAETAGLWIINTKLIIPPERMFATHILYQCTIISFVGQLLAIPFHSLILAKEKMDLYAYVGMAEALLLLIVAYLVKYSDGDRLILYGLLTMVSSLSITFFYIIYNYRKYAESHIRLIWDKIVFKNIFSYSGWSLYGSVSLMLRNQGINMLLNMFFGPVVNAARAIAYQIDSAVLKFVTGFYQAVRPQLTKYYASGNEDKMLTLAYRSTRLCFCLYYIFAVPLFIEIPVVLKLWLGTEPPEYTILFVRLILINSVIESLATPLKGVISSTGIIKKNQLINGTIRFINFPLAWFLLEMGFTPDIPLYIAIVSSILCHLVRIKISIELTNLRFVDYITYSILPIFKLLLLIPILPTLAYFSVSNIELRFVLVVLLSITSSVVFIWLYGMFPSERKKMILFLRKKCCPKKQNL